MNPITINTLPQELAFPQTKITPQADPALGTFKDTLSQFVNSVNDLQGRAADTETAFLKGDITDVHQVMIAVEEASVAFELLMEIRNKLLEAYQTIQRMPI
ncbi:MAG: flagellar hook-basal body complex protein FliE [Candidatus Zixiibacteriota bacterium]